jgi:glutamate N-acetyltransferase/amino-acid N-acetyltransferase
MNNDMTLRLLNTSSSSLGKIFQRVSPDLEAFSYESGIPDSPILPPGFRAGAVNSRTYYDNRPDLGLIVADSFFGGSAIFPRTSHQTAPVMWSEGKARSSRAILTNSGFTDFLAGKDGARNCRILAESLGKILQVPAEAIMIASAGVPYRPFNPKSILPSFPELVRSLRDSGFSEFSSSILTNDLYFKMVIHRERSIDNYPYAIFASAEKSGGEENFYGTPLLAFILTDLPISSDILNIVLPEASMETLSPIFARGVARAGDSIFILSSGTNGAEPVTAYPSEGASRFRGALTDTLAKLSEFLREGDAT